MPTLNDLIGGLLNYGKQTWDDGGKYRKTLAGLLSGDTTPLTNAAQSVGLLFNPDYQQKLAAQAKSMPPMNADNFMDNAGVNAAMSFAPLGITKVGHIAPYDDALEAARIDAWKNHGLPENNTAMDRAKAAGFEDGWGHGSPNPNVTKLESSKIGAEGKGAYATNYFPETNTYALQNNGATVYPLMVNREKTLNSNAGSAVYDALKASDDNELSLALKKSGLNSITAKQPETPQWLIDAGAPYMPERLHYVSEYPQNFRSRFAAFNLSKLNSPDLLASLSGLSLAGLLGSSLYDKRTTD